MNRAALSIAFVALGTATAFGAPQTFNTALPVAEGEFVARQQVFYKSKSDDPTAASRDVRVLGSISVLGYGVTGDFSLFGVLPVVDKRLKVNTPGGRIKRSTSGLGDARLFARYTVFKDNAPGRTFRIAPFAGLKLPTGKSRSKDAFGLLPFSLQAGSGSFDPFGGVVATFQTLDFQFDAQASFKLNTRANNYRFGNEARLDASLQYRLWPQELEDTTSGFLYGVLEGNLVYRGRDELGGVKQANTGGTQFFISPGLQYVTQRWIAEAVVQIPVLQNLHGTALKDSFTVRTGIRFNF